MIDFCPGRFYRLGACDLFWLFSRRLYSVECIAYLVWITFQGRNLSNFLVVFWKIDNSINTFWHYMNFRFYNSSAIYFCAKKEKKYQNKEKKEYELVLWRRSFLFPLSHSLFLCQFWWDSSSGPPRLARSQRPGPCLDFGFQYSLIRNNRSKTFGVE